MDSLTKIARKTFFLIFMKWAWTRRPQDLQIQSLLVDIEMFVLIHLINCLT